MMLMIEMKVAMKNIMIPCIMKSITYVNKTIETNTKIDDHIMMVWNLTRCCITLSNKEPTKNPPDLQKNKYEYYVYLCPVLSAR